MKKLFTYTSISLLIGFTACSSLWHKRNEAVVSQIKKVAVIGFIVQAPASNEVTFSLNSKKFEGREGGSMINKKATEVDQMYEELVKSFEKNMKWKVVSIQTMKLNQGYQKAYDDTMRGWQNKYPPGQGMQKFEVDGIMDYDSMRILGKNGRTELIKALGVDAIICAQVDVLLKANTVMGIGNRYPWSRLNFTLFTPNMNEPDWFEGNLEGNVSKTSLGSTAFFDENLLNKLALESARTAYLKIGQEPKP